MHKLAKGLKKKKKQQKKGKKGGGEEEEFDPEELERYRRERAEAQQKAGETATGSDEWKKFEALTAGVDSILKKTQGDLDRIKSTSFFQRKPPLADQHQDREEEDKSTSKEQKKDKWIDFDEHGNPIERDRGNRPLVNEDGFVDVPEDDDEQQEDSAEEDIFDTTYVDVLQEIDVKLAYIPDSPTEEELGDDPFDTTNADKVLKTVDKKGNKLVSLGNAVEVLSGRIDYVSSCKISKTGRPRIQEDLLLDDFEEAGSTSRAETSSPVTVEKTLLDDDTDLPDGDNLPVDFTKLPTVLPQPAKQTETKPAETDRIDISEFELLQEKTILEEIPDLDDAEFEGVAPLDAEAADEDPFREKEENLELQSEIIEASFEAATFVNEEDPFDTSFADNLLPGKAELKFIEKELEELPVSEVSISLTDPAGLNRDYETGLLKTETVKPSTDLLSSGSTTDLSRLADQPIPPIEEIGYVDPFDTSTVQDLPPGKTELKFIEKELLGEQNSAPLPVTVPVENNDDDDDDFDPRKGEEELKTVVQFAREEATDSGRRPEVLELSVTKTVGFDLPTPSKRPDLLVATDEEKALPSKPLTPYYSEKSIDESFTEEEPVDPFDTSFVAKVKPGKTELKLLESELLEKSDALTHINDPEFDPRAETNVEQPKPVRHPKPERQESLLDAKVEVDAKPLTPRVESKRGIDEPEEELSYRDPFDTSIAVNILPGKAELKVLESELEQITEKVDDFDPRADERKDILCFDDQDLATVANKVLTPIQNEQFEIDATDPFDTSFATLEPGKTELKLLESELMDH